MGLAYAKTTLLPLTFDALRGSIAVQDQEVEEENKLLFFTHFEREDFRATAMVKDTLLYHRSQDGIT